MAADLDTQLPQITQNLTADLAKVRTGRATSALVEDLKIPAYGGTVMALKELASISIPEPRQLLIAPWDKSVLPDVEKGLRAAGFNPTTGEDSLRIIFPPLTGEERERLIKEVGTKAEEAKISARVVRKDALYELERSKEAKEISEDEYFTKKKQVDEKMESFNKQIDLISQERKESIEI